MEEKEKKKWCSRHHGGVLHTTLYPNEVKCNLCNWSKTEINFADYLASNGYVGRRCYSLPVMLTISFAFYRLQKILYKNSII